ncbi:GNAT family N-acetyltransferase [Aquihabitans sp. McL0605]|uniref:GNAT family N-acetyltransferase n=1 Tax=Aquihabitans sp. McL0605 TaxID=3415671 RepID=UPI003CEA5ED5
MADRVVFRRAGPDDLAAIVGLLTDDVLGADRESAAFGAYEDAFAEIDADPRHLLVVGDLDGEVVACLQATVLPCLTHGGRRRAQLEGVRVSDRLRGGGVGAALIRWSIDWARGEGCGLVQLTTDKRRPDALRFYERLGFTATHEGMKLAIAPDGAPAA